MRLRPAAGLVMGTSKRTSFVGETSTVAGFTGSQRTCQNHITRLENVRGAQIQSRLDSSRVFSPPFVATDSIREDGFSCYCFVCLHPANILFMSDFPAELHIFPSYIG